MDRFLIVDGEDFTQRTSEQLERIETFLGVNSILKNGLYQYDSNSGQLCVRLTTKRHSVREHKSVCLETENFALNVKSPNVAKDILQKLHEFYEPHMKIFSSLSDVTFQWLN